MTLQSLWRDRHPVDETTGGPRGGPVEGEHDVVIVGGGLTGLTLAGLLARAGKSVLVVEARHLGAGTTGGSTAKVSLLQGTRLGEIAGKHSETVLQHYLAANEEGQAWIRRFCEDHGVPAQERPAYTHATTTHGATLARREHDTARELGLPVSWETDVPLPFPVSGAVRLADQLQVDPLALVEALAADARSHGARIVEGARVRKVHRGRTWTVQTDAGDAAAQQVVLATNLPLLDRGGWFARMRPARSYALAYRTPGPAVDGMYLSSDRATRSLRGAPVEPGGDADDSLLLVGGEGHTTGRGGSTRARLDTLREWTAEHFPGAVETHAWSAQDYAPSRSLPVVGPLLPGEDDLLVSGGYSKWGLTNGVAGALALSARILGGHVPWTAAFEPWHRRDLAGLPTDALLNAEVGLELARGYVVPAMSSFSASGAVAPGAGEVRYDRVGTPTACANVDGAEHRVSGVCTHLGGVLRWNDAEQSWDCPLHGSRFALDGEVLEGPATAPLGRR